MNPPMPAGSEYSPQVMPPVTMPAVLCRNIHLIEDDEFWLHIEVVAEPVAGRPWPHPIRADLGRRIADMIKADVAADAASVAT